MDARPAPVRVAVDVTRRCNLACCHCRHGDGAPAGSELTFDEIVGVVDDLSRMGVFRLVLSGGEPLLREDLGEILLHALGSRIGRVFVSTNGLCLDALALGPLRRHRDRLTFKVSLDGPAPVRATYTAI